MPKVDYQSSTITLRTRASGLLAKLAHDLEIAAEGFEAALESNHRDRIAGVLRFPVSGLRVVGALRAGRVVEGLISASDREEIERRIREQVLPGERVIVELEGDRARLEIAVRAPAGEQQLSVALRSELQPTGGLRCSGTLSLSLAALGIDEIKGPLGAFKVDDRVEVAFWVVLD